MVERHGDAQAVGLGQPDRAGDHVGIVQDVGVRQCRAFRRARGAAGELDVDRLVRIERGRDGIQPAHLRGAGKPCEIVEGEHAGGFFRAHADDRPQRRHTPGLQPSRLRRLQFRRERTDHFEIVARLEARRGDQRLAADLVQHVFEFGEAVGRIDRDQHQPDARGGELRDQPFGPVRRPDADPVPLLQPEREEPRRHGIDLACELAPGVAPPRLAEDRRLAVPEQRHGPRKRLRDRLAQERNRSVAHDPGLVFARFQRRRIDYRLRLPRQQAF